jgi:hypothetical protein
MIGKQTTLDLNGPILSFVQQPVSVTTSNNSVSFVGIATAFFPEQSPANSPSNTGYISYQWYEVGVDLLSNNSKISGVASTTLTITNLQSPNDSERRFYLVADYVASAYGESPITAGTARSTGNAINDGLSSDVVTLKLNPTLFITSQPQSKTVSGFIPATFEVDATTSDGSDNLISYNWLLNGNQLSDSANILNSNTEKLTISLPAKYDATVYHEISPGAENVTTVLNVTNTGDFKATVSANVIGGALYNNLSPGTTLNNNNRRHYDIKFESDLGTTNYDVEVTNIIPISAKGTSDPSIGVGHISKRTDGFRIWFYRSGDFVCGIPQECLLTVWPPNSGTPTDVSISGSESNPIRGLSIDVGNPSNFVQQKTIATGINYSGTFTFSGTMNSHSPSKNTIFRIRAVLPNGTTVATSGETLAGSNGSFSTDLSFGPVSTLENLNLVIDARFSDNTFQTGVNVSTSTATWSGTNRSYEGTVFTVDTHIRGFKFSLLSLNNIQAKISHPTANNSPIFSNVANFSIVSARAIINFENFGEGTASLTGSGSINLFDNPLLINADSTISARSNCIYAPERDIRVRMTMAGSRGNGRNGYRAGYGGVSIFEMTLLQNVEYIFKLGTPTGFGGPEGGANGGGGIAVLYRQGNVLVVCGGGGGAGTSGRGGDGGGIGVSGENGQGRGNGAGGYSIQTGTLDMSGSFAGGTQAGPTLNPIYKTGGKLSKCTIGNYWRSQGVSPCSTMGNVQSFTYTGTAISGSTSSIIRGYKAGIAYRNNGGNGSGNEGGGGAGVVGGNAATGSGAGGGGASGYSSGEVTIVSTQLGGNDGFAYAYIELLS